ncbi:MAG: AAA family ATPase [Selenomonadaceae bacterium]|nr:AAA family ATPase [Selenomonadaceae bacterium]
MARFLNPNGAPFKESLRTRIYEDKSAMIEFINQQICTRDKYICVSRPRRFGKSMALDMLAAYYCLGRDYKELFKDSDIASMPSFEEHLNKYNVLKINMQDVWSKTHSIKGMLGKLVDGIAADLLYAYPDVVYHDKSDVFQIMEDIYDEVEIPFVILIDEWDCLFRVCQGDTEAQKKYLDFLRLWLKDKSYIGLVYMTGILPIHKYGTHSALNMFIEYSITNPRGLAAYFGFTDDEVQKLCKTYHMDYTEIKSWYDGYELLATSPGVCIKYSMYSPKSVVEAINSGKCDTYWNNTETYEALKNYIKMNYNGLKDDVVAMLAGESVPVDINTFGNDMTTFHSKDDIMTLLVHLGYLTYDSEHETVSIPNREVAREYITAIKTMKWPEVTRAISASEKLLQALMDGNEEAVAEGMDMAHNEISILKYNDENSLSCAIHLAFYAARDCYNMVRELPAGRGFADIVLQPRPMYADKPAILIELKWDKDVDTAIRQIHEKCYDGALKGYADEVILAGISYDKTSKKHQCVIEKVKL